MLPVRFLKPFRLLLALFFLAGCHIGDSASAAVVTLNALTQGRYRSDGVHFTGNYNTGIAYVPPSFRHNAYLAFDLANLTGTVDSASLNLELDWFQNDDINQPANAPLTFDIFDVSTSVPDLDATYAANDAAGIAVHNDLGSGNIYATRSVIASNLGSVLNIPLSAQAIADIQASLNGTFAVGLRLQGPDTATHILRFGETIDINDSQYRLVELQFNLTPLPPDPDPLPEDESTLPMPEPGSLLAWVGMLLLTLPRGSRGLRAIAQ